MTIVYDRVVIPAIVLAAGKSTRMGRTKALLPLGGGTFLSRIIDSLRDAGVPDIVVVLGHDAEAIAAAFGSGPAAPRFVVNDGYEKGQLSSLLTGLAVIDRPGVTAALMTLVDVPLVSPRTIAAVLDRFRETHAPVVRPVSHGRHGHPVLFDRAIFDALRRANDAEGAKPVIRRFTTPAGDVDVDDEGAVTDVDTPEEYLRVQSL